MAPPAVPPLDLERGAMVIQARQRGRLARHSTVPLLLRTRELGRSLPNAATTTADPRRRRKSGSRLLSPQEKAEIEQVLGDAIGPSLALPPARRLRYVGTTLLWRLGEGPPPDAVTAAAAAAADVPHAIADLKRSFEVALRDAKREHRSRDRPMRRMALSLLRQADAATDADAVGAGGGGGIRGDRPPPLLAAGSGAGGGRTRRGGSPDLSVARDPSPLLSVLSRSSEPELEEAARVTRAADAEAEVRESFHRRLSREAVLREEAVAARATREAAATRVAAATRGMSSRKLAAQKATAASATAAFGEDADAKAAARDAAAKAKAREAAVKEAAAREAAEAEDSKLAVAAKEAEKARILQFKEAAQKASRLGAADMGSGEAHDVCTCACTYARVHVACGDARPTTYAHVHAHMHVCM